MTSMRLWASTPRVSHVAPSTCGAGCRYPDECPGMPNAGRSAPAARRGGPADPREHRDRRLRRRTAPVGRPPARRRRPRIPRRRADLRGRPSCPACPFVLAADALGAGWVGVYLAGAVACMLAVSALAYVLDGRLLDARALARRPQRRDPHLPARARAHARRADGASRRRSLAGALCALAVLAALAGRSGWAGRRRSAPRSPPSRGPSWPILPVLLAAPRRPPCACC